MSEISPLTTLLQDDDLLSCPVCHDDLREAILLPCLHSVCTGCVTQGGIGNPCCPVCNACVDDGKIQSQPNLFVRSLREFSDTVNEEVNKSCDYCAYSGRKSAAVERCLQCCDNLCSGCADAHRKTKLTRDHSMASFSQIAQGKHDATIRKYQQIMCSHHQNEALRYHCNKCDKLLCRECKVSQHDKHNCADIQASCNKFESTTNAILTRINEKIERMDAYSDFLSDYHLHVENSKVQTVRAIEQRADMLHKMVEQYRQSLIDKIMPPVIEEQANIEERQNKLTSQLETLKYSTAYVENLLKIGTAGEILHSRNIVSQRLTELAYLQPETMTTKLSVFFREGRNVGTDNNTSSLFGTAEVLQVPLQQDHVKEISNNHNFDLSTAMPMFGESVRLVKTFECQGSEDKKDVWPSGITIDISGNMLIVDRENRRVKMYNSEGILLREFGHSGTGTLQTPYDIAVLHNGNIAVTDYEDESIKIYNHTGDFITKWKKDFKYPRGITTNRANQVLVVDCHLHRVSIHDPETGAYQGEISGKTADKCELFNDPYYITTNTNGNIIVTDWVAPNIKLFDNTHNYLSKYGTYGVSKDRMLQPYGVCTDAFGYIFVADNHNHRIHLLGPDGKFIRFLIHEKHGLWHPMAITINQEGHLVITESLGKVKIFKYI